LPGNSTVKLPGEENIIYRKPTPQGVNNLLPAKLLMVKVNGKIISSSGKAG
jgi:hypothetical protein